MILLISLQNLLYRFLLICKKNYGLLLAIVVAMLILFAPTPQPIIHANKTIILSLAGKKLLALLAALVVVFITEALPMGIIIGVVYSWIVFFGIFSANEAAKLFSHDAVWFLAGALMTAQVLIKYGLHKRVLYFIIKMVGSQTKYLSLGIIAKQIKEQDDQGLLNNLFIQTKGKTVQECLTKAEEKLNTTLDKDDKQKENIPLEDLDEIDLQTIEKLEKKGVRVIYPNLKYNKPKYQNVSEILKYVESDKEKPGEIKLVIMNFND